MPRLALYAGSFDPPTNGHVWMIERGAALFDRLVVAIGINPAKSAAYSTEQRLDWLRTITGRLPNVEVASFGNLFLAAYAGQIQATHVLRGIRSEADFGYEQVMRHINADLNPHFDSVFLMPPREISEVSSSLVRSVIGPEGWHEVVRRYVPGPIYDDLVRLHA
ncbi:MAG: pantetheine-phosphate adenylyltransferase [Phycisphaerales bacterium]|nr:pantetheine-phosphate adenylyltransferase [Phycisphaerales bacterium]